MNENKCKDCPKSKTLVSGWICCGGNSCEMDVRNKTIKEFVKRIERNQTHHDGYTSPIEFDMSVDMTDILKIAEQMKGESE